MTMTRVGWRHGREPIPVVWPALLTSVFHVVMALR